MLISRRPDGLTLVTQQEHARLAGTHAKDLNDEMVAFSPGDPGGAGREG